MCKDFQLYVILRIWNNGCAQRHIYIVREPAVKWGVMLVSKIMVWILKEIARGIFQLLVPLLPTLGATILLFESEFLHIVNAVVILLFLWIAFRFLNMEGFVTKRITSTYTVGTEVHTATYVYEAVVCTASGGMSAFRGTVDDREYWSEPEITTDSDFNVIVDSKNPIETKEGEKIILFAFIIHNSQFVRHKPYGYSVKRHYRHDDIRPFAYNKVLAARRTNKITLILNTPDKKVENVEIVIYNKSGEPVSIKSLKRTKPSRGSDDVRLGNDYYTYRHVVRFPRKNYEYRIKWDWTEK